MCTRVFALLAVQVGFAYCFTWDVIVGESRGLQFYNNGTLTHTEDIPSAIEIYAITYDPVHNRVFFADNHSGTEIISSFYLSTRSFKPLVRRTSNSYLSIAYDPATQLLFWQERDFSIYSLSLNPAFTNEAVDGNLIVTLDHCYRDIAVDSCGGYIYWITDNEIERARFDGSEREVLFDSTVNMRVSLVIDQQTQKMYWTERIDSNDNQVFIKCSDLHGKNRRTLYTIYNERTAGSLTVSNDFIYWNGIDQKSNWQLPKNHSQQLIVKQFSTSTNGNWAFQLIAAKYAIRDQLKGNQNCETLKSLIPNESEPDCTDVMLCMNGTKVTGKSRCECTAEKCNISVCQNYCFQGNCSVSAEGQPKCSCNAGYSGERCVVYACHKHCLNNGVCSLNEEGAPICQCTADFEGETCSVPICKDYCVQGNCSVSSEGQPICSCTAGYSGQRCEVNACHKHCLNNGVCSLNEEDEPVCECTADYEGERCEVVTTHTGVHTDNTSQHVLRDLRRQVRQVIKEELRRAQQFFSDKIDEYEVNI